MKKPSCGNRSLRGAYRCAGVKLFNIERESVVWACPARRRRETATGSPRAGRSHKLRRAQQPCRVNREPVVTAALAQDSLLLWWFNWIERPSAARQCERVRIDGAQAPQPRRQSGCERGAYGLP